ncbi:hypothetical protein [Sediminibacterium sp.]|uniref:hypothetical protein n=1 Tax=Sediminibacterium sp. TaxID=1917865 RepID=UPI00273315B9|nr:hypothetical protein [Sediminibacterium sp.]MDP3393063.1 hypothetical protein [Sediminibacterium sp.]MDP3567271.1 hypothetical protein [Sediminibacterium sp.]
MEIEELIHLFESLSFRISAFKEDEIKVSDIEDALFILLSDEMGFKWRGSLWDIEISEEQAFNLLSEFDFLTLNRLIETDIDVIPEHLRIQRKARIKSGGLNWIIHLYDKDPFPSNPHAHLLDSNIKLDLSNGNCYCRRKFEYKISHKSLIEIREKAAKVFKGGLPELTV